MVRELFKKIPREKVSDKIFNQVKELIVAGKLLPGQKIPSEMELLALFNVSRSSVREAVLRLECLGFVEQRHGEGTFVKSATEAVVLDYMTQMAGKEDFLSGLMEVRAVLETWAAGAAAQRASEEDIRGLEAIVAAMGRHSGNTPPRFDENVNLHRQIAAASRNPFLIHMMSSILGWIGTVTGRVYADSKESGKLYQSFTRQHEAIVTAIAQRDPQGAKKAMAEHLGFASLRIDG